jgi:hypothetical protein
MKKLRILAICIAVGVLILEVFLHYNLDAYMAIQNAYEDREAASVRVNDTGDPKALCVHDIETEEVAVQLEFRDVTKDIEGLDHRYRLDVECRNKSRTQYRYRVELNGYSDSLITDGDDAEFISGNNYGISESSGRLDVEFVPKEKQGNEGMAGCAEYRFYRNSPAPIAGSVSVTITTYLPYFDLKIHSFTQELTFRITEP